MTGGVIALVAVTATVLWTRSGPATPPRDRPLPAWSPDAQARIVAFGTSLTHGNGWPDRVVAALNDCLGTQMTLHRVSAPGRGSGWALGQIDRVAALAPDLVLFEFAINDADLRDGVRRATSRQQHARLVAELRDALPDAILVPLSMSPASGLRGLMRPALSGYYADVADLAQQEDLGFVDLYARWRQAGIAPPADGLHPDDAATRQVVDAAVTEALVAAVARAGPLPAECAVRSVPGG